MDPYTPPVHGDIYDAEEIVQPQERSLGLLTHLLGLSGYLIPFASIIGPLVIFISKKDQSPFVRAHAAEALNFNLCYIMYIIMSVILCYVIIGFFLIPALTVFHIVVSILAAIRAHDGRTYQYPMTVRFFR